MQQDVKIAELLIGLELDYTFVDEMFYFKLNGKELVVWFDEGYYWLKMDGKLYWVQFDRLELFLCILANGLEQVMLHEQ